MTPEELAAIRSRNEGVRACFVTGTAKCRFDDHDSQMVCMEHGSPLHETTDDIDALLAEVERLRIVVEGLRYP